jgi:uncharacterized protein
MKQLIAAIVFILILTPAVRAQQKKPVGTTVKKTSLQPENQLRQYFFVMLLKGPNRNQDSVTSAQLQEGHMANINRLYEEGKIKVAGPFGDDGNWRGIFIFDCATAEEVDVLLKTDPAVKAGRLSYEIHPWWTAPIGSFTPGKPQKN